MKPFTPIPQETFWYVIASARGLQDYILRSPKLVDMVGASELIEWLVDEAAPNLLDALKDGHDGRPFQVVGKSAGAIRLVFREEKSAKDFVQIWPYICERVAPGLEMVCAIGQVTADDWDAIRRIEGQVDGNRNIRRIRYPVGNLATEWNPQTGRPSIYGKDGLDAETAAKRDASRPAHDRLLRRCIPPSRETLLASFAKDFTDFGSDESAYLAIVHIDTNGLGVRFQRLARRLSEIMHAGDWVQSWSNSFVTTSRVLAEATQRAVQDALTPIIDRLHSDGSKSIPIRPLVCAGDDVTLVMRADFALQFTETYLKLLPIYVAERSFELPEEFAGSPLTAAAGVVFVPVKFPFYDAYDACERLVKHAKSATNREVSGVSFARFTAPNPDADLFPTTLLVDQGTDQVIRLVQSMCPYTLAGPSPQLSDLLNLVHFLSNAVSPGLREFPRHRSIPAADLRVSFQRICDVLDGHSTGDGSNLRALLAQLTKASPADADCFRRTVGNQSFSPIHDALNLVHLGLTPTALNPANPKTPNK